MSYRETFRMNQRDFDEEKQDQTVMKEKLELSSHATSNTTIISGRPWYHRLYQMLANPFRWIFLGYIKYQ